jgi:hydroxymethylpyrimidine/phosphomethylpyrimidine kinase
VVKLPQIAAGTIKGAVRRQPSAIVVVGGVDPGGGAGLLRDVATARALDARAHAVGTAWTEQADGVHVIEPRAPAAVHAALRRAVAELSPPAVKIGMAVGPATAAAILDALAGYPGEVVVDPVLASSRGGPLWSADPQDLLPLLRRATVATPNAAEAGALTALSVTTVRGAELAAKRLVDLGMQAVLVKGGHLEPRDAIVDILATRDGVRHYSHARLRRRSPRGTGCALSTAIAVGLSNETPLGDAVAEAIEWLAGRFADAVPSGGELHLP